MTDVEAFLAQQQRYRCERLAANLTVAQCEQNRTRGRNMTADVWEVFACKDCAGLGAAVQLEERTMAKEATAATFTKLRQPFTPPACSECGEVKKIHGYGQCSKCLYKKYGKSMRPPVVADDSPKQKLTVKEVPHRPEVRIFEGPCAACGRQLDGEFWADECPLCMGHPVTGAKFQEQEVSEPEVAPVVASNPLLRANPGKQIILDLFDKHDLWAWLQESEIKPEHIIELLECARVPGIRLVS
jgi:hypothetical protein